MQNTLAPWQKRLEALGLRERIMALVTAVMVLVAALDHWVVSPVLAEQARFAAEQKQWQGELTSLAGQLQALKASQTAGPLAGLLDRVQELKASVAELDDAMTRTVADESRVRALKPALARLLSQNPRIALVKLESDPALPPASPPLNAASAAAVASAEKVDRFVRHRLNFTVEGPYLDLLGYLEAMEREMPDLRWSSMKLGVTEAGASRLSIQLYLLSLRL